MNIHEVKGLDVLGILLHSQLQNLYKRSDHSECNR